MRTVATATDELGLPLPLSGTTRIYAILGDPIAQAGSPGLFNAAFRRKNINAVLIPIHVAKSGLDTFVAAFRAGRNFDGLVITVPHKIEIANYIDEIGPMAKRVGAVNAIRKLSNGRLFGDNFDGLGFLRGFLQQGHSLKGRRVLVIGAGGAGSAVTHAILDEMPSSLGVFDLDESRVTNLVRELKHAQPRVHTYSADPDANGYDVVVNCTSVGMKESDPLPLRIDRLDAGAIVVDIVLEPSNTPLLQAAAQRGCRVHQGIHMLAGQVEEICRFYGLPEGSDGV